MSFIQNLKRKAIDNGKNFYIEKTEEQLKQPKDQCGFKMSFIPVHHLKCQVFIDSRAVVSLALVNPMSLLLESYANKLPMMAINVSRLSYTIEAFTLQNKNVLNTSVAQQALDFYFETDVKHRDKSLPPNEQFSKFLHRLKSPGYLEYIFDLARKTDLNVDYVADSKVAARYIKIKGDPTRQFSTSIGFLTAIHEPNNEWYVKILSQPIVDQQVSYLDFS